MRKHWFFDLDGTLAETGTDIRLAWKKSIAELGRDCPRFDEIFTIGPTLEKVTYQLFDDATPELVAALVARFGPNYDSSGFPNTVPYPHVPGWLNALKEQGCSLYIATNKRAAPTVKIAEKFGWDGLFDGIWSFDSFPQKLKKAELLAKVCAARGIDAANDAVMVGDTKGDVDAGAANGMHTIGCTWGYGSRAELEGADEIYDAGRFN